jgi:hypothetical protein
MLTRFGLWYLATLAPAVGLLELMRLLAPLDPTLSGVLSGVISVAVLPILPVIMTAMTVALRVDTDSLLPGWYRRMFGAAT